MYVCRTQVKELVTPIDVIKVLESDFNEHLMEDSYLSQEDLHFITIMKEGVKIKTNGHCELPLPFKKDKPNLPDNKICDELRLKRLKKRFEKDMQYHEDYATFMNETITCGDAEKVPPDVAVMCDIECMFHQFHVKPEGQSKGNHSAKTRAVRSSCSSTHK